MERRQLALIGVALALFLVPLIVGGVAWLT